MIEECQPLKKQGKFYWTNYDMRRDATEIRLAEIALCGRVFVERVRKKEQHEQTRVDNTFKNFELKITNKPVVNRQ